MLRLLGLPRFDTAVAVTVRLPAKAYILLASLVLQHRQGVSRGDMAALLWGDSDQAKAYANLRQLLTSVARWETQAGIPLIALDGRNIVPTRETLGSDLGQLLAAKVPITGEDVRQLAELGLPDLLSGIETVEAELSRWVEAKREQIRIRIADLFVAAGERTCLGELEYAFGELSGLLPLDERVLRARMANLVGLGNDSGALKVYSDFSERLKREMDAQPELETRSLAARISARGISHVSVPASDFEQLPQAMTTHRDLPTVILIPPRKSLVVSDKDMNIAELLVSDVTLQLCRTRRFAMFAPHTARQLVLGDPLSSAAPYGLDYIVTTSIFPGTPAPRLAFSLIATGTQQILVADEIELRPDRLLSAQAALAAGLASSISEGIAGAELQQYRATGAASAYVKFLLGSGLIHNTDLSQLRRSRRHLAQALKLSPDYVPALGAMARTLSVEWLLLGRSDRHLLHEAKRLAARAAQLDPLSATGHRELGHASMYLGDLDQSEEHFETALDRAPHHADILADRADILVHNSRMKEAKQRIDQAIALNPLAPDDYRWISGSAEFFLENYAASLTQLRAMSDHSMVDRLMAAAAAMAGDKPAAKFHRDRWMSRYPDFRLKDFATFMPHRSKADIAHFESALAMAGFA